MDITDYPTFVEWTLAELANKQIPVTAIDYVFATKLHERVGFQLEFGVYSGTTINRIAEADYSRTVWGFDSFQGIPEPWRDGYPKGALATGGRMPKVRPNVVLVPGWFHETLPRFKEQILKDAKISLLHIDSDVYSSAMTVLRELRENIVPSTVIIFDELLNYPGFEEHELKALYDFCHGSGRRVEYIGCPGDPTYWAKTGIDNALYQQAIVRIV